MSAPKSVLVTGCSSGIGEVTAVTLARRGFRVFATARDLARMAHAVELAAAAGAKLELLQLDVTSDASVKAAVAEAELRCGRALDVVVNNAGYALGGALEDVDLPDVAKVFDTNLYGALRVMQAVLPAMRARRQGRILNVTSASTFMPFPGLGAYTSSKAALETYSFTVASEVRSFGVEVAVVAPGLFRTAAFGAAPRAVRASSPTSAYRHALPKVEADIDKMMKTAPDPQACADGIADLCEARTVGFRNLIGGDAWRAFLMYHLVPTDWMLKLIGRVFGRMLLLE